MKKRRYLTALLFAVIVVLVLFPVFITLLYSFSSTDEIRRILGARGRYGNEFMDIALFPRSLSIEQYQSIFDGSAEIIRYYINSVFYTFTILAFQLLTVPAMAYGLSRFEFQGRNLLFYMIMVLCFLPFQITMVPAVLALRRLRLLDTVWAIILPSIVSPFYVLGIRQSMLGTPNELFDAAQLDGAGTIRCYFSIALPTSKPILMATAALSFAECWNMIEQPLAYLPTKTELYSFSLVFVHWAHKNTGVEFAEASLYFLFPLLMLFNGCRSCNRYAIGDKYKNNGIIKI